MGTLLYCRGIDERLASATKNAAEIETGGPNILATTVSASHPIMKGDKADQGSQKKKRRRNGFEAGIAIACQHHAIFFSQEQESSRIPCNKDIVLGRGASYSCDQRAPTITNDLEIFVYQDAYWISCRWFVCPNGMEYCHQYFSPPRL